MCDIFTAIGATAAATGGTAAAGSGLVLGGALGATTAGAATAGAAAAASGGLFTMANLGLAASALGTAATVYGQYQSGQAAKAQGEYQAAVAYNNQIIANRNAALAQQQGELKAKQQKLMTQQLIGAQRAGAASSGVTVDTGSALISQQDTAALGELSEQNIKYQADMEAYNYKIQASDYGSSANLVLASGNNAYNQGLSGAAGSLLVGGSQFADKWNRYKRGIG